MKASTTVIYDIGMSGVVTRPMGCADLEMDMRLHMHMQYICMDGIVGRPGECVHYSFGASFTRLRLMEMNFC